KQAVIVIARRRWVPAMRKLHYCRTIGNRNTPKTCRARRKINRCVHYTINKYMAIGTMGFLVCGGSARDSPPLSERLIVGAFARSRLKSFIREAPAGNHGDFDFEAICLHAT